MKRMIFILLFMTCVMGVFADNVKKIERNGKVFTEISVKKESKPTGFTYKLKGVEYDIFLSSRGKAYIIKTSKKGNTYRYYLPEEVTEQIKEELKLSKDE